MLSLRHRVAAVAMLLLCFSPAFALDGWAQSEVDALWTEYATRSDAFIAAQTRCDEGNIQGTTTNRLCSEAVDTGLALAGTIEALIAIDGSLTETDREMLLDGLLTSRQIAASIQVDLGQCEQARTELVAVRQHPGTASRPVVAEAAERWIALADECIAEAEAEAERTRIAEREAEERLEREAAEEERARAAAERQAAAGERAAAAFDPPPDPARSRLGPVLLTTGGGLVLAGALTYDLMLQPSVREFRTERDRCQQGLASCDAQAVFDSRDRIRRAKPALAVLYGVGGVTAISGVTWMLVRERGRDARSVRFAPMGVAVASERFYGARVGARF